MKSNTCPQAALLGDLERVMRNLLGDMIYVARINCIYCALKMPAVHGWQEEE